MKKLITVILCILLTAAMLTACGSGAPADPTRQITLMIPEWGAPDEELLKGFTEETGIQVIVNEVGWDNIRDKVAIAAAGGAAAADVIEVDWSWVGEFNAAGWLEPLTLTQDETADMPTLDTFTIDGQVLAVPYANDYRLSYYNTAYFEQGGITREPNTWQEVLDYALRLKSQGICEYPVAIPLNAEESAATSLFWLAYSMSGQVFNEDGTLNEPAVMAALEYEHKLLEAELVDPADKSSSGMDAYRRILSGEAAFMTGPTSFVARSSDPEQCSVLGQVTPILIPGGEGKAEHTMPLPEAIGVTRFSKNKEDAQTFVKWYTSPEIQFELFHRNSTIPTHNSVLSQLIQEGEIVDSGAMLKGAQTIGTPFPGGVPSYYAEMSNAVFNAVNKMALGTLEPAEAFAEMDAKVKELAAQG